MAHGSWWWCLWAWSRGPINSEELRHILKFTPTFRNGSEMACSLGRREQYRKNVALDWTHGTYTFSLNWVSLFCYMVIKWYWVTFPSNTGSCEQSRCGIHSHLWLYDPFQVHPILDIWKNDGFFSSWCVWFLWQENFKNKYRKVWLF